MSYEEVDGEEVLKVACYLLIEIVGVPIFNHAELDCLVCWFFNGHLM